MNAPAVLPVDLDASATTPVSRRVLERMMPYFREEYGNPSSPYEAGERAKTAISEARASVASFLGCESREIVFTSGGTESNQAAVRSALRLKPERRTIVLSAIEHSSILGLAPEFESSGYRVRRIDPRADGRIAAADVAEAVDSDTALVAVMWVNNETGAIAPVAEIAGIAHRKDALFHCDGVAAVGKVPVDLSSVGIDSLSLSAHKIYGPKGVGALFVRRTRTFHPLIPGAQERKRRGGTENVPGKGLETVPVGRMPESVSDQDRLRLWPRPACRFFRIEREGPGIDIGKNGFRPLPGNRPGNAEPGERRSDHLVARPDSQTGKGDKQSDRGRGNQKSVGAAKDQSQTGFENINGILEGILSQSGDLSRCSPEWSGGRGCQGAPHDQYSFSGNVGGEDLVEPWQRGDTGVHGFGLFRGFGRAVPCPPVHGAESCRSSFLLALLSREAPDRSGN